MGFAVCPRKKVFDLPEARWTPASETREEVPLSHAGGDVLRFILDAPKRSISGAMDVRISLKGTRFGEDPKNPCSEVGRR